VSNEDVLVTAVSTDADMASELRQILGRAADLMNEIRQRGWDVDASLPLMPGVFGKVSGKFVAAVNISRRMTL
jgi:hypothetical protein